MNSKTRRDAMKKYFDKLAFSIILPVLISVITVQPLAVSAADTIEIRVSLIRYIEYTSRTAVPTEEERKPASEALRAITQTAYDAFIMDHPKKSMWIDVNRSRIEAVSESRQENGLYIWKVKELKNRISVLPEYRDPEKLTAELEKALDSFTPVGDTLYDRIKSIHDYICLLTEYDASGKYAYSAYGALVDRKSVCEGYAEAFRLICDRNGIECILVSGIVMRSGDGQLNEFSENHMWNYVRMDDGKWYAVDATWDDGKKISHEYLLVGSDTVVNKVSGRKFAQNHIPSGDISGTGLFLFTLPELSEKSYKDNNSPVTETSGETSGETSAETSGETSGTLVAPESDGLIQEPSTFMTDTAEDTGHVSSRPAPAKRDSTAGYYYSQLNEEQKNFYNALMKVAPPSAGSSVTTYDPPDTVTTESASRTDTDPPHVIDDQTTKPPKPETTVPAGTDTVLTTTDTIGTDTVSSDIPFPHPGSDSFTVTLVNGKTTDVTTATPPETEPPITFRYVVHVTVIVLAIGSLFCIVGIMILKFQRREKK